LIGAACVAGVAAGVAVAGLAGGAVPMAGAFWPDAGAAASSVAMATTVKSMSRPPERNERDKT
jgi:hypothetical protein